MSSIIKKKSLILFLPFLLIQLGVITHGIAGRLAQNDPKELEKNVYARFYPQSANIALHLLKLKHDQKL